MVKNKFIADYQINTSKKIVFHYLSTASGLQEWFADKVDDKNELFVFNWGGSVEKAEVLEREQDRVIRFHWVHSPANEYFEFKIEKIMSKKKKDFHCL